MYSYEFCYVDTLGQHAEVVDAYDQEQAVQEFRLQHQGELVHLTDINFVGYAEEPEEVPA